MPKDIAAAAITRLGGWIEHDGKKRPANITEERIEVLLRSGRIVALSKHPTTWWHWHRDKDPGYNFMAYRIIK